MSGGRAAFRPKATTPRVVKLGRRYSLHYASDGYALFDDKRPAQPRMRYPLRERGQALNRYHELEDRHRRRRSAWVAVLAIGVLWVAGLMVAGLMKAFNDADSHPLVGAILVETPNGVPYVAFIPSAPGTQGDPVNIADDARGKSALLRLLPVEDLAFSGPIFVEGTVPHPAPGPDPGPKPSPGPGPSPSPTPGPPSPSATSSPSLTMTDSPPTTTEVPANEPPPTTVEPTTTPEPSPTAEPSTTTEPPTETKSPEPKETKTKTKPPKP